MWTEGRALGWDKCMHDAHAQFGDGVTYLHIAHAQKESRGKYKKLEHSNEIYFPTLMFSAKSRTIERKRLEQIRTDLAVTPNLSEFAPIASLACKNGVKLQNLNISILHDSILFRDFKIIENLLKEQAVS